VPSSIDLDDDACLRDQEIDDEAPDGRLTADLESETPMANSLPQEALRFCCPCAKQLGATGEQLRAPTERVHHVLDQSPVDVTGLYVDVYIWDPVGSGKSSFGHVSVDVNGTVFSFGPDRNLIADDSYTLLNQEFRGADVMELNLTPEQEEALYRALSGDQGKWRFLTNNCGDPLESALEDMGVPLGVNISPGDLRLSLVTSGAASSSRRLYSVNPYKYPSVPWAGS
jgi:hypothetical protein